MIVYVTNNKEPWTLIQFILKYIILKCITFINLANAFI